MIKMLHRLYPASGILSYKKSEEFSKIILDRDECYRYTVGCTIVVTYAYRICKR